MQDRLASRRRAIKWMGGLVLGGAALAGCDTVFPKPTPTPVSVKDLSPIREANSPHKERIQAIIKDLPASPIKDALVEVALPYFQNPRPQVMTFYDVPVRIDDISVDVALSTNPREFRGEVKPGQYTGKRPPSYPIREEIVKIPLVGLIKDEERRMFAPENTGFDGTPLASVIMPIDKPIYEGISPEIRIFTPNPALVSSDVYKAFEQFTFVKEACSLMLDNIWIQETVKKMRELCLPTAAFVKQGERQVMVEIITQSFRALNSNNGRWIAANDLAGYLLATKALEGTDSIQQLLRYQDMKNIYPFMRNVDVGVSPQDLLYRSYNWAIVTPEAGTLAHRGSIQRLP